MTVGERIAYRRKALGLSAEELGEKVGKNRSTIYRYESGDIEKLPMDALEPIAKALNTTVRFLMGVDGNEEKRNDVLSDIILRLRADNDFLEIVELINNLDGERLTAVKQMLTTFLK